MSNHRFKIYTLGCKVNQYDSASLAARIQAAGFVLAKDDAELAIINTCAVTKSALRKGRQMAARARRENPRAKIIVTGCAVKIYKEEVGKWGADLVVEEREAEEISKRFKNYDLGLKNGIQNRKSKIINHKSDVSCSKMDYENVNIFQKSRYFIKVQDGCRQFCTYCVIPYARGELKSRAVAEVVAEARAVVDAGIKEIVLCGIHLGLYGVDRVTHNAQRIMNLTELIKQLGACPGN